MKKKLIVIPVAIIVIIAVTFTIFGGETATTSMYIDGKNFNITQ